MEVCECIVKSDGFVMAWLIHSPTMISVAVVGGGRVSIARRTRIETRAKRRPVGPRQSSPLDGALLSSKALIPFRSPVAAFASTPTPRRKAPEETHSHSCPGLWPLHAIPAR